MRQLLKARVGQTVRVTAYIERYGSAPYGSAYLLKEVRDAATSTMLTDHVWVPVDEWANGFRVGDSITFTADVRQYVKGYLGDLSRFESPDLPFPQVDWTLFDIRDAEIVEFGPVTRMMPDGSIRGGKSWVG